MEYKLSPIDRLFHEIKNKRLFFILLSVLLVVGLSWLVLVGKATSFIAMNTYHATWLDIFFIYYTNVGDGIVALVLAAVYFVGYKKVATGWMLVYAFLLSGLISQLVKNSMLSPRPKLFFTAGQYLHFIDGVTLSNHFSFPSGHTATTFAVATILALRLKAQQGQLFILVTAVTVAYSRVYLGQHFLADILAGAFIGTLSALVSFWAVKNQYIISFTKK